MAQLIKADGEMLTVAPKNGHSFEREELQELVGGNIEEVHLEDGRIMVINEEGKIYGLPVNDAASKIAESVLFPWDMILGDALVCTREEEGEDDEA